ncbi:urea carboxylase, partial [bacterium]
RARPAPRGVALQVRVDAEDPHNAFNATTGTLTDVRFPTGARVETWVARGTEVAPWSDPLIARLVVHGETRDEALRRLRQAMQLTRLSGIETSLAWLRSVAAAPAFITAAHTTRLLEDFPWTAPAAVRVLESGVQSTVQDWPGRVGYWDVGVPPSGPMDEYAFRVANRLVGNERGGGGSTAGLECTMTGPVLRFDADAVVAVTGAPADVQLDGEPFAMWTSHAIPAGSVLRIGRIPGPGSRPYLAIAGGIDVAPYLGSRSTFMLGRFGGHGGRSLRVGDVLHLADASLSATLLSDAEPPVYPSQWTLGVLIGPQASPDFLTPADVDSLFSATWTVHFKSSRAGLRLVGPKPQWARTDGGEAGLNPAAIHDNAYAVGSIVFNGDMPVIVGPDDHRHVAV